MDWLIYSFYWYGILFFLGILFIPLTQKIFRRFPDLGYPFAKILAILFVSYAVFVSGIFKILPFTQFSLLIIIGIFAFINIFISLRRKKNETIIHHPSSIILMIIEEFLFLSSFLLWVYIRGQEPSIRSLEKFMDFGFMNSILRSRYFPPIDIWLAGSHPINYYYFGHLIGTTLIKLTNIKPSIGYNLILSTIFGLSITGVFSLVTGIISTYTNEVKTKLINKLNIIKTVFFGILGSIIVNLGGNLHTIYLFTKGYPNENPVPFWQILSGFNPATYWYPNATRFIQFTIHEFPSYSYVVADLHGHVFDIPFVLLTLAVLFVIFMKNYKGNQTYHVKNPKSQILNPKQISKLLPTPYSLLPIIFLGFLTAVHYMTNAFDGPIYLLLSFIVLFFIYRLSFWFLYSFFIILSSFFIFSLPFSYHFTPFVTGIGVNCSPQFLVNIGRIGPFLFEKGNCQISPFWMLFVLWGFFWINFVIFLFLLWKNQNNSPSSKVYSLKSADLFIFLLFAFGTFLVIIPEFFYIKDIYPAHFRANTMFKLGYQAFIMMGIASTYVFFRIRILQRGFSTVVLKSIFIVIFLFISVYYFFAVPSYYGALNLPVQLDGSVWLSSAYPEDKGIIDYLNTHEKGQPVILEAQGDSYTDFERISAFTGLPTVAGWWVHEWLWRGSSNVIAKRISDVIALYESPDLKKTQELIDKYKIKYVVVSNMERQKYIKLNENKFRNIGRLIFRSSNGFGALYQVN